MTNVPTSLNWLLRSPGKTRSCLALLPLLLSLSFAAVATEQTDSDDWDVPDEDIQIKQEPAAAAEPPAPLAPKIAPNVDLKNVVSEPAEPPPSDSGVEDTEAKKTDGATAIEPAIAAQSQVPPANVESAADKPMDSVATESRIAPAEQPAADVREHPAPAKLLDPEPIDIIRDTLDPVKPAAKPHTFRLLGADIEPGTSTRLAWTPSTNISGLALPTPVLVINGKRAGPTLCLTAAIHGDELNGIEIVRRVMYEINPDKLKGRVIGVPIVNLQGFQRGSRYLPDRRDLNRHFPGDDTGSLASRIAASLFKTVLADCNMLVDIHTGSLRRTNLPQVRADMRVPEVARFTEGFDDMIVVHGAGGLGMLRWAFVKKGIPAVTLEMGESMRIDEYQIKAGVRGINGVLDKQKMYSRSFIWGDPEPVYYQSIWVRVEKGGILFSDMDLNDKVSKGEKLGVVIDPITNETTPVLSPIDGRLLGMAVDQVVMPGFAAYHLGKRTSEENMVEGNAQPYPRSQTQQNPSENSIQTMPITVSVPAPLSQPSADKATEPATAAPLSDDTNTGMN
jgi:predicted deacylase